MMRKYISILLTLAFIISIFSTNPVPVAAADKAFNQDYVGWKYGKTGAALKGIIPALNNKLEQRPWELKQWKAYYKFSNGQTSKQSNYDVFNIKKQYASDSFDKEDGFGLLLKTDPSLKAFFDLVMNDEGKKISKEQLNYFRGQFIDRSRNPNLKLRHPTFFKVENENFLYVPGVIQWMGGRFEKIEKISEDSKIAHYLMSDWPRISVNTSACPISIDFKAYGYTDRDIRVIATKKGAFPNLSQVVSLTSGKLINTNLETYAGNIKVDCNTLREQLGEDVDIIIDDGYGRTIIETIKVPKEEDTEIDFVPTKLNLTDSGQLWMTFRYDGDSTIKSSTVQHPDGMPMLASVKIGGAITTDFDMGMMYKQLPAELKPGSTYNVMLGKIDIGTKPGKYYIKITGIVNNPSHPKRSKESPSEAYQNNDIKGEWLKVINEPSNDLMAISVTAKPSNIKEGSSTIISANVKNAGTGPQKNVRIRFTSNGKQIYEVKKDMPANKTIEVGGFIYKPGKTGSYTIAVHVDPLAEAEDKNRSNNVATTGCSVYGSSKGGACAQGSQSSFDWAVTYHLITGYKTKTGYYSWTDANGKSHTSSYTYTDYNDPIWTPRSVGYKETLKVSAVSNTKQGIPTDKNKPKESDRESRGSWEIIPWAKKNGLDPNKVTRAGYGFELKVTTNYFTDWETKVPSGLAGTPDKIGGKYTGPEAGEVIAKIYDTKGRWVENVTLEKTAGGNVGQATWELPKKTVAVNGKKYIERKYYTDKDWADGTFKVVIVAAAKNSKSFMEACITENLRIYGSMYDDSQNIQQKK